LEFFSHIRPEKKFSGLDELKAQIKADVQQIQELLTHVP
jgi:FAD synthase